MIDDSVQRMLQVTQTGIGLAWVFGCACRVHLMDRSSRLRVRLAMSAFAGGGLFFSASPWVAYPYHELFETLAGAAVVWSLWINAALWRRGVPSEFGAGNALHGAPRA